MDDARSIGRRFLKPVEVAVIVLLGKEARLAIDASLDEVLGHVREFYARATGHWAILEKYPMLTTLILRA